MDMLEKDISKLCLSNKEAKIYLAALELGPSPVQIISQKAKVNRATTYVIIDSLMEKELVATFSEGKKTFFVAEPPECLLDYLKSKKNLVEKKISLLTEKIPELRSLASAVSGKPTVKYFEGLENGAVIYAFLPWDQFSRSELSSEKYRAEAQCKRIQKKITLKIIYASESGRQLAYEEDGRKKLKEFLYVAGNKYPFEGGMNIYGDKILMIDYAGKTGGLVIENKSLAKMLAAFFCLIWDSYNKKK